MQLLAKYIIPENFKSVRLLDYGIQEIKELTTRNAVKKAIKRGELLLNSNKTTSGIFLKPNDIIELFAPEQQVKKVFELKFDIYYEDDYLAIINKPAGISVSGNYFRTIQNALPFNLKPSPQPDKLAIPRPIHRLDNPTSGLLIIAKTHSSAVKLGDMIAKKQIVKKYLAITISVPNKGKIDSPIDNKNALSEVSVLKIHETKKLGKIALVELSPKTGRTHQLRIHMSSINCPIVGDKEYGTQVKNQWGKGLFLLAYKLEFNHPLNNKPISVEAPIPNKFKKLFN